MIRDRLNNLTFFTKSDRFSCPNLKHRAKNHRFEVAWHSIDSNLYKFKCQTDKLRYNPSLDTGEFFEDVDFDRLQAFNNGLLDSFLNGSTVLVPLKT
jgi:hypothetical protein